MNLINRELAATGIVLDSSVYHPPPEMAGTPSEKAASQPFYDAQNVSGFSSQPQSQPTDYLFQSHPGVDTFGAPDPMAMEACVFESMSTLEPLSAWVGTIHEFDPPGPSQVP